MLRWLGRCVALLGVLVTVGVQSAVAAASTAASTPVPAGFVGVNLDGPMYPTLAAGINPFIEGKLIEQSGVESVRLAFSWAYAQPYATMNQVPAALRSQFVDIGGVPTRFSQIDSVVRRAARLGISVLPDVLYAPAWDDTGASSTGIGRPTRTAPYAAFLTALVHRYGTGGSFWTGDAHPVPITRWQIWNEPNVPYFWPVRQFAPTYVALLKAAAHAIRTADPSAKVVLAGLTNYSWEALATLYKVPGARAAFDIAAAHPYTTDPAGVITILGYVRTVMDNNGDAAKPLIATELGWTSAGTTATVADGGTVGETTPQGQADKTAALLPLLAKNRTKLGLSAFYLYTWASSEVPGYNFSYSGLFSYSGNALQAKPAYGAFRTAALALEDCRRKGSVATSCAQR